MRECMRRGTLLNIRSFATAAVAASLSFLQPALADSLALDDVIVTATRRDITTAEALPPVIVISREQIERSGAQDVAELLRFESGVEVARNGGPGQLASVFIRGANSNHTLVLIDGVKVNPGTAGGAALQNIPPELVERIEIVKGPRSSLHGSEAIGGVVNIITRRGAEGVGAGARVQAGQYGTRGAGGNLSWQGATFGAGVSATALRSDGFPTYRDSDRDSGFDNDAVNAWVRATRDALSIEASHFMARGNVEYADFFRAPQDQDFTNRLSRLRLDWDGGAWRSALTLARYLDRIEQGALAFDPDDFVETERDLLDWQVDFDGLERLELTAGIALNRERTAGRSYGAPLEAAPGGGGADRDQSAIYLQAGLDLGRHRLAAAVRRTDHDMQSPNQGRQWDQVHTWNLEWGVELAPAWSLAAGLGRGFRAPSTTDLYAFGGNPLLEPEISRNLDLVLRHRPNPDHEIELALFSNQVTDLIQYFDPDGFAGPLPGRNENIGEARIRGAELAWRARYGDWQVTTTMLTQRPEDRDSGERLLRRAEQSATAQLARRLGAHELGLQMLASGERRDFGGVRLAGYVLLNLTARVELAERWTLRARLENLLDQDYELVEGYNTPGRGIYASLAYSY